MNTPICDFVQNYKRDENIRLHMPGHKGVGFMGVEGIDITEVDGADVLYSASGIIEESQNNASSLFGTEMTLYSCEGSSLCIRAMLYLATLSKKSGKILASRNVHKAFLSACALLDIDVEWLSQNTFSGVISQDITSGMLKEKLASMENLPCAVYLTSPDYLGNMLDIKALAEICHDFGVLLVVDNAHGAYLNFLCESKHPISLGADMCCDSAHKTLPVLTGGAYLHIAGGLSDSIYRNAKRAMALFASTSPSYLILQSLDMANKYMATSFKSELDSCVNKVSELKNHIKNMGFETCGDEKIKITVSPKSYGYSGIELYEILKEHKIVCEFADSDYLVMMFTPSICDSDYDKIKAAFSQIERREPIGKKPPMMKLPTRAMSIKEATMSDFVLLDAKNCHGRILASECVSCPPAVPILACGEIIDYDAIKLFEYYGIEQLKVIEN